MLLKIAEFIFIVISLLLGSALIINKTYICHVQDNMKKSDYVAGIALLFALYILSGFCLAIFVPGIYCKIIMMLFALSPFIIGRIATYEKEKFYTFVQILSVWVSCIFMIYSIM